MVDKKHDSFKKSGNFPDRMNFHIIYKLEIIDDICYIPDNIVPVMKFHDRSWKTVSQ